MRHALLLFLLALSPLLCGSDKPNVVIIFIDDLGYADIGPFGATKQRTPHLDRMAREGMKFTSFYAAPVCSVSRAQLLTGCYGVRISVPGVYPPGAKNGLHPQENTIADHLRQQGYATQCIGKWHLGDQPDFLPTRQGFDHYFGIPYSNDMQKTAKENGERVVPLLRDEKVGELLTDDAQSRLVERYTEEAVAFIRANKSHPFFLYLPHSAVHTPIHPGAAFAGKSENGRFGDWVEEVDWSVGRVLDTLRELELHKNTLVVFTSDNGPWLIKGPDGGSAGPLRGGKGSTWEGGVRVPALAWWPGKIAPGSVSDAIAGTIDLLPTCVRLAGAHLPAQPVIDGRDLSPVLFGEAKESGRKTHYYFAGYNLQAVRQGPWKLALTKQVSGAIKGQVEDDTQINPRLYNLGSEIGERTNVADRHPEVVARLKALADAMSAEIGGTEPRARRPAGEVENPRTLYPTVEVQRGRKNPSSAPRPVGKPVALETLKPGDTVRSESAPHIANTPFRLSCTVATSQANAILVAHGGASIGYVIHLKYGKAVWTLRHGKTVTNAETSFPNDKQPHRINATLQNDGRITLQVDDTPPAAAVSPGLLVSQPKEDFCVGHDNKVAVTQYADGSRFEGTISGLKVTKP